MKRRSDLIIAFWVALAVHSVAGVCVVHLLVDQDSSMRPSFREGYSSVDLTLSPSRANVRRPQVRSAKEPGKAGRRAPVPHVELVQDATLDMADVSTKIEVMPSPDRAPDNDADLLKKGVVNAYSIGISEIRPRYPFGARQRGEEGEVTVAAEINAYGRAGKVMILKSSGYPSLDRAAAKALREAEFVASNGSVMNGGRIEQSFRFELKD